jgi:hypothetical protein
MQLDGAVPEQLSHGFTPLPAVVENSPLNDSERCALFFQSPAPETCSRNLQLIPCHVATNRP